MGLQAPEASKSLAPMQVRIGSPNNVRLQQFREGKSNITPRRNWSSMIFQRLSVWIPEIV
jgi:hypothetical protein